MRKLRKLIVVLLLSGLLLVYASNAFAAATSFTQTFKNVTETFTDVNPCTGDPGTLTITYNGVVHVTIANNGSFHTTGTFTGDFVFDTTDPTKPDYTGHFTNWFGDNDNSRSEADTVTFTVHGTGSDGSTIRFHETAHFSVSASGVVISFDKMSCG